MKKFLLVLCFSFSLFAQYSKNDYELAKTTFLREFDPAIIQKYLSSNDSSQINAALLSVAQSGDTSFVKEIIKLDFEKFGRQIAFTLGQLGQSKLSADYLIQKLETYADKYSKYIFESIGKVGDEEDLSECIRIQADKNLDGFPLAVYNFHLRGITDSTETDISILQKNLKLTDSTEKLFRSLFALYRVAPNEANEKELEIIFNSDFDQSIKTYALGILRKQVSFPYSFDLAEKLMSDESWSVRCEAARAVSFYEFENGEQIDKYLNLFYDENPSVARAAAQSLVIFKFKNEELKEELINTLRQLAVDDELTANVRGEILLTLHNWLPDETPELYSEYQCMSLPYYTYQLLGGTADAKTGINILKKLYDNAEATDKFFISMNIGNHYESLKNDPEYSEFIIDQYASEQPLVMTLNNFLIDSAFVYENRRELKTAIEKLITSRHSDTKYNAAIASVFTVTDMIDTTLTDSLLSIISVSDNFDLQYDLQDRIELTEEVVNHRVSIFNEVFSKSFKYKSAKVKTSKGDYTIKFNPEAAPVSVGNFIHLAEQGFYDNIIYHRVVPNFVIQAGDSTGTGWGGPAHTIVSEFSDEPFKTYYVGMASSGKDTEGSQWFVMNNFYPHLNGNYTNFGKVIDGFEVVDKTDQFDMIYTIELIK